MPGLCVTCGSSATSVCSKCRQVYYCSPEHQRQDWKRHKTGCTPTAAAAAPSSSEPAGTCARCLEACGPGTCRVPHPVHLRTFAGGFSGRDGTRMSYACGACSKTYTEVTPDRATAPTIAGAAWCFEGRHSAQPLPAADKRRVTRHAVTLTAGPNLQRQIDEPPQDVEILSVISAGFGYDDKNLVALARPLPNLTELHLVDVAFSRVILTGETTPKLRTLQLQNVPEACDLQVVLPELRSVSVHYWGGDEAAMHRMLEAATKLEEFDSYKLWSNNDLTFASPALRSIDLHRADTLESITLWAPNIVNLNLQACYSLEDVTFLETHELAAAMPRGSRPCKESLRVNVLHSNISPAALEALYAHPRAEVVGDEDSKEEEEDEGGDEDMPGSMEEMLAALRARGMIP